jgi:hypothetical protein
LSAAEIQSLNLQNRNPNLEIRNPAQKSKHEIRNPKQAQIDPKIRSTNLEIRNKSEIREGQCSKPWRPALRLFQGRAVSNLPHLLHSNLFRVSNFEFRIFPRPGRAVSDCRLLWTFEFASECKAARDARGTHRRWVGGVLGCYVAAPRERANAPPAAAEAAGKDVGPFSAAC